MTMAPIIRPWSRAARLSELEPNIGKGERGGMAVLRHAKSPEAQKGARPALGFSPSGIALLPGRGHNLGAAGKFPETMSRLGYGPDGGAWARPLGSALFIREEIPA